MANLGADFSGGFMRRLYVASNPAGLGWALGIVAMLLLFNVVLQTIFGAVAAIGIVGGEFGDPRQAIKGLMIGIFPAGVLTLLGAWVLARTRGGVPLEVLSLRRPALSASGWSLVIGGFVVCMYGVIMLIVLVFGIDVTQYTPGPDGQSPETGSVGLVKEAMFDLANEPLLFWLVLPAVGIGAPLAEEVIFRGQLFSALSQTRLGFSGTAVITSLAWSGLHLSEPWFAVGIIFVMGLALAWMLYRFGSLWVTIAAHGAWNTLYSFIIFGFSPQ